MATLDASRFRSHRRSRVPDHDDWDNTVDTSDQRPERGAHVSGAESLADREACSLSAMCEAATSNASHRRWEKGRSQFRLSIACWRTRSRRSWPSALRPRVASFTCPLVARFLTQTVFPGPCRRHAGWRTYSHTHTVCQHTLARCTAGVHGAASLAHPLPPRRIRGW